MANAVSAAPNTCVCRAKPFRVLLVLVGEDNPAFEGVFEFCTISAGGSIDAAKRLASGATDIAINWAGGLHHAKKREVCCRPLSLEAI